MSIVTTVTTRKSRTSFWDWISSHGFEVFLIIYGTWVWLPFLAPVFMNLGWTGTGKAIYFVYSFFCHQLPERSLFFFGEKTMYALNEIQAAWQNTSNPMILRQFIGNAELGWKVAWSDRMISFYTSVWLFALAWWPLRRRVRLLPWWGLILLLLPMMIDGSTHMVSDLAGIGAGFRDSNLWLARLTNYSLPQAFYAGDALGSFNSWMRLLSGLLAGIGINWFVLPYIFQSQTQSRELGNLEYARVIEQIRNKSLPPSNK
jgi:uncharacterized membrane protein